MPLCPLDSPVPVRLIRDKDIITQGDCSLRYLSEAVGQLQCIDVAPIGQGVPGTRKTDDLMAGRSVHNKTFTSK